LIGTILLLRCEAEELAYLSVRKTGAGHFSSSAHPWSIATQWAWVPRSGQEDRFLDRARARPPRRPADFFWALVPPCFDRVERLRAFFFEPELFPPRFEAPGELEIAAARDFDIPFSFRASYCFRFFTCPRAIIFLLWFRLSDSAS
jgi:hypothetical protein